jgi:hypothetical protein
LPEASGNVAIRRLRSPLVIDMRQKRREYSEIAEKDMQVASFAVFAGVLAIAVR